MGTITLCRARMPRVGKWHFRWWSRTVYGGKMLEEQ